MMKHPRACFQAPKLPTDETQLLYLSLPLSILYLEPKTYAKKSDYKWLSLSILASCVCSDREVEFHVRSTNPMA